MNRPTSFHTLLTPSVIGLITLASTQVFADLDQFTISSPIAGQPGVSGPNVGAVLVDIDLDNDLDFAIVQNPFSAVNTNDALRIYKNNGHGKLSHFQTIELEERDSNGLTVADTNGDGIPELVLLSNSAIPPRFNMYIYGRNLFEDELSLVSSHETVYSSYAVEAGFFNTDSYPDFVTVGLGGRSVEVFLSEGDGNEYDSGHFIPESDLLSILEVSTGDLNGDGLDEIVMINYSSSHPSITILPNNNGSFPQAEQAITVNFPHEPRSFDIVDFDNDSDLDIVVVVENLFGRTDIRILRNSFADTNGESWGFTQLGQWTTSYQIPTPFKLEVIESTCNPGEQFIVCSNITRTDSNNLQGPETINTLHRLPNGTFEQTQPLSREGASDITGFILQGDLDNDGDTDVVLVPSWMNQDTQILLNPCQGPLCPMDMNEDGRLNAFDFNVFIESYTNQNPRADLAAPIGSFNFFDISTFINEFSEGCPSSVSP